MALSELSKSAISFPDDDFKDYHYRILREGVGKRRNRLGVVDVDSDLYLFT